MAELTINTADITAAIKQNLEGFTPDLELTQVGRVVEVGDGIARVSGLPDAAVNELLEFESGLLGLALNLDEDSIGGGGGPDGPCHRPDPLGAGRRRRARPGREHPR
jgi:F-type H+-transporting ATPase subunit alpha